MQKKYITWIPLLFICTTIFYIEINLNIQGFMGKIPTLQDAFKIGFRNYLLPSILFNVIIHSICQKYPQKAYALLLMFIAVKFFEFFLAIGYKNYNFASFHFGEIISILAGFILFKIIFKHIIGSQYAIPEKILNSLDNESIKFVRANGMKIFMGHYFEHNPKEDESAQNKSIIVINKIICPVINSILMKEKISLNEIQEPGFIRSLVALSHILQEERALREEAALLYPELENDAIKIPNLTPKRHKLMRAEEAFKDKMKNFERYIPGNVEFSNT